MKYMISNDTLTVYRSSGAPITVTSNDPVFKKVRELLLSGASEKEVVELTQNRASLLESWSNGRFKAQGDDVLDTETGTTLPKVFAERALKLAADGVDPTPLCLFAARLSTNPSFRSVTQLWSFMQHVGIPVTRRGTILAYKSVRSDLKDHHSGTYVNAPGVVLSMPRNQISDDPNEACHVGFHVGALQYAQGFGSGDKRLVICEVDPADVVCVPYDHSAQKMRVCKYRVVGFYSGQLPDDVFLDDLPTDKPTATNSDDCDDGCDPGCPIEDEPAPKLDRNELAKMTIDQLRKYATHELKMVGASKVPGGKWALIEKIVNQHK